MWFTDLLHICNNIAHLQTELVILFRCIVKQNHCFCCEGVCVLVVVKRGGGGGGQGRSKIGILLVMLFDVMLGEKLLSLTFSLVN